MDITSPGEGVLADRPGVVSEVGPEKIVAGGTVYTLRVKHSSSEKMDGTAVVWPQFASWHEPAVAVGDNITKKQVLARGVTHIYFQANRTVFTVLLSVAGVLMGLGMAAVFKHIPEYYPNDVPVVGGLVGVIGGLGGFVMPIVFGYALKASGVWTTCFLILAVLSAVCLVWMHFVIARSAAEHEKTERAAHLGAEK